MTHKKLRLSGTLDMFIRDIPLALAIFDPEMRYIYASERWCSDYGLHGRQLEGLSHYDVFPEIPERWREAHRRGLAGESLRAEADRFERLDGSVQWVRWDLRPWYDQGDEIGGIIVFTEDITERKNAEIALRESEFKYRSLFENIDEGFCIIEMIFDTTGKPVDYRFLEVNPAFEKQTGLSNACGKTIRELSPLQEDSWFEIFGEIALSGQPMRFENKSEQLQRCYDVFAFRSGHPAKRQVAILYKDITLRKKAEVEIIEAKKHAEKANQAKSEFLANMSHEIRTPMTVFLTAIEQLLNIDKDPKHQPLLKLADKSASHLLSLIDDILDFSRIEAGKVELAVEPIAPHALMDEVFMMFKERCEEKGLTLSLEVVADIPPVVMSDRGRLKQVLINLTNNAIKFTPHGEINLTLETHDDVLEFVVADTGIGIPIEKQPLLFKHFSQIDASFHRQNGGTGLGLAISRKLVELMGGHLDLQSEEGKGSVFRFSIPMKQPTLSRLVKQNQPKDFLDKTDKIRILLAEDNPMVSSVISLGLDMNGWQTEIAATGSQAVTKWREGTYDIILMDLQMPDIDGLEATKMIRREEAQNQRIPILGFTAHAEKDIVNMCIKAGMDRVLSKPIANKDLINTINGCLAN